MKGSTYYEIAMKILYVEDDHVCADIIGNIFEAEAPYIEMDWAESLSEAKKKLDVMERRGFTYDAILTDMNLGDGNGITLIPYLRKKGIKIPVVIITGFGNEESVVAALKAGATDYVVKRGDCFTRLPWIIDSACRRYREEIARFAQNLRILYVEPNKTDAEHFQRHIAHAVPFMEAVVVGSGEDALELLMGKEGYAGDGERGYDVFLVDYRLQGMSGIEFMKELREVFKIESPIVFVASHGDEESALLALRLGAADYVVKTDGYLNRLVLIIESVYNKSRAEREHESLKDTEEYYRSLIERTSDVIAVLDETGVILYGSPSVEKVLGFKPQELIGANCRELIHPSDLENSRRAFSSSMVQPEITDERIQIRIRHKNNSWRYLEAVGSAGKDRHDRTALIVNLRDITDRKAAEDALMTSEQRFRDISEAVGEYIFEIDLDGRFTFTSDRIVDLSGLTPDEIRGRNLYDFVLPSERERVRKIFVGKISHASGFRDVEMAFVGKTKETVWLNVAGVPIFDARGVLTGCRGAALDITARKMAEEKIKASLREKEVLLKEIHHRVKNNLQVISSLLKLQSSYFKESRIKEAFNESQGRIKTIALVHQKLYQSGDMSKIDFESYARDLSRDIFRAYGVDSDKIRLETEMSRSFLDIDTAMPCGLIISELLSNSLKYAFVDRKRGKVTLNLAEKNGRFILKVGDDGTGLPDSINFRDTRSLGLQLVNTLVEQLEGTIELEKSAGTRFVITFIAR